MLNKLYNGFASYYAAITNDRDFKNQTASIIKAFDDQKQPKILLELFAGQSAHSLEAFKNYGTDIWAIDSSPEMKQLATDNGFQNPEQYLVGNLPETVLNLNHVVKFDCILALFNGICNLDTTGIYQLFNNIKKVLNPDGKVFIEIQNLFYMMEYISDSTINQHDVVHPNGDLIKYAWPGGKIKWSPYTFTAEVPVKMMIQSDGVKHIKDFVSIDHIHSTEVILFLAHLTGFKGKVLSDEEPWRTMFDFSILLELSL